MAREATSAGCPRLCMSVYEDECSSLVSQYPIKIVAEMSSLGREML